jgi:hypothetical protein
MTTSITLIYAKGMIRSINMTDIAFVAGCFTTLSIAVPHTVEW